MLNFNTRNHSGRGRKWNPVWLESNGTTRIVNISRLSLLSSQVWELTQQTFDQKGSPLCESVKVATQLMQDNKRRKKKVSQLTSVCFFFVFNVLHRHSGASSTLFTPSLNARQAAGSAYLPDLSPRGCSLGQMRWIDVCGSTSRMPSISAASLRTGVDLSFLSTTDVGHLSGWSLTFSLSFFLDNGISETDLNTLLPETLEYVKSINTWNW